MYRNIAITRRALFAATGELVALVADAEDTPSPLAFLDVPEGEATPTREAVAAALAETDSDTLTAIIEAAVAEGQAIAASDAPIDAAVLARINLLADAREAAEERLGQIEQETAAQQEAAAAALARLAPPAPPAEEAEEEPAEEETPAEGARTPEPVAAAAPRTGRRTTVLPRPGGAVVSTPARPAGTPSAYTAPRASTVLTAAAGVETAGLGAGGTIETREQLGHAILSRLRSLRNVTGGDGENVPVASLTTEFPPERMLTDDLAGNTRRIREATSREALVASGDAARANGAIVAAGGLCAPLNVDYAIPVLGSAARPVRDSLTGFGADSNRGGMRWRENLSFADMAGATSVWTIADDEAVGTGGQVTKPCIDVICPDDAEAYVEAITMCMTFSNITTRFDPEQTAANIEAAGIAHARFAENRLMAQIAALSTTLTAESQVSAIRDYLTTFDRLIAAYRNFYRLDDNVSFHAVHPRWLLDAIRSDLTRGAGMSGDLEALAVTEAQINAWFATRNVNSTWHLDGRTATVQAGTAPNLTEVAMPAQFYGAFADNGAVPQYPTRVETLLWVEGTMMHLDGGTLDLGVVRDSSLNQVNRYKQFSESFEGVAHRGVECIRLVQELAATGMTAGTMDTTSVINS